MDFKEAFKVVVSKGNEKSLKDPFYIYSLLSDLCKSSYEKKDIVKKYFQINKYINLYQTFLQNGLDLGLRVILGSYKLVKNVIAYDIYETLANDVLESIEDNEQLLTIALCNDNNVDYSINIYDYQDDYLY